MLKAPNEISVAPSAAPSRPAAARNRDFAPSGFSALIESDTRTERPAARPSDARATRDATTAPRRGEPQRPREQEFRDSNAPAPEEISKADCSESDRPAQATDPAVAPPDAAAKNLFSADAIDTSVADAGNLLIVSLGAAVPALPVSPVIVAAAMPIVAPAPPAPASTPVAGVAVAIAVQQVGVLQAETQSYETKAAETKAIETNPAEPAAPAPQPGFAAPKPIVRQVRTAPTAETISAETTPATDIDAAEAVTATADIAAGATPSAETANPAGIAKGERIDGKPASPIRETADPASPEPAFRPSHPAATTMHGTAQNIDLTSQISLPSAPPLLHAAVAVSSAAHLTAAIAGDAPAPLNGLAVEIATRSQAGTSSFSIRLDPADLGRIDVRLDVDSKGQVTSHLTVEKPETLAMLRQDAPQLQRALNDAGLKTSDNALQFSLGDQASAQQNADRGDRQPQRLVVRDDDIIAAPAQLRGYGRLAGTRGGIDIRI